jgi:hypothetical protein
VEADEHTADTEESEDIGRRESLEFSLRPLRKGV